EAGSELQNYFPGRGHVDVELFVEHDRGVVETILGPELPGSECRVDRRHDTHFQRVTGPKRLHGDVLLAEVGVDGGDTLDRRAEILHRLGRRLYDRAIALADADERDLDP